MYLFKTILKFLWAKKPNLVLQDYVETKFFSTSWGHPTDQIRNAAGIHGP